MKKRRFSKILGAAVAFLLVIVLIPQLRWALLDFITPNYEHVNRSLKSAVENELRNNGSYRGLSLQHLSVGCAYGWQKEQGCFYAASVRIGNKKSVKQKYYYYDILCGWRPLTHDKPFYDEVIKLWTKG